MIRLLLAVLLGLAPSFARAQVVTTQPSIAGIVSPHPGYIVNNWYTSMSAGFSANNAGASATNTIVCSYDPVASIITIGSLGASVQTTNAGNMQLAVYSGANGRPASLIASTGNISMASATAVNAVTSPASVQIGPGSANGANTWFCYNNDNGLGTVISKSAGNEDGASRIGSATQSDITSNSSIQAIFCAGANCTGGVSTFNTWPASLAGSTWTTVGASPRIAFKITSVP